MIPPNEAVYPNADDRCCGNCFDADAKKADEYGNDLVATMAPNSSELG